MSVYDSCKSGVIQRGEELFNLDSRETPRDYNKIAEKMQIIPKNGERLMSTDEVMDLYD